jgi:hypothetical protein
MVQVIDQWKNRLQVKWSVFTYNFGWSDYVFLFDGGLQSAQWQFPSSGI